MGKYIGREPTYGIFEKQVLIPDGVTTTFVLNYQVGTPTSLLVVYSGVVQQPGDAFNLGSGGTTIVFSFAPDLGQDLYIIFMGKELQVPLVTTDQLALSYDPYSATVETFGDMTYDTLNIDQAEFADTGQIIKLRLTFSLNLTGTPDNKVRISLPIDNSGQSNVSGSATIYTDTNMETGIIRWGDVGAIDIYRQFGTEYSIEVWNFEINLEYESE